MHYHDGNGIGSPVEIVPTREGKYKIVNDLQETARMHKVYTAKKKKKTKQTCTNKQLMLYNTL